MAIILQFRQFRQAKPAPPPHVIALRETRRWLCDEIELLISLVDRIDGDPDMEPDDEDQEHDGREVEGDTYRGGSEGL